jgi:hypothetical protein
MHSAMRRRREWRGSRYAPTFVNALTSVMRSAIRITLTFVDAPTSVMHSATRITPTCVNVQSIAMKVARTLDIRSG